MDTQKISDDYMDKYNDLSLDFKKKDINNLVERLNEAVSQSNMAHVNELYNQVLEWNNRVKTLEGAQIAINTQFRYLHLPSPSSFAVIFDGEDRLWKFNI